MKSDTSHPSGTTSTHAPQNDGESDRRAALRRQPRILIVDDDEMLRSIHGAVLSMAGYETESAKDGQAALDLIAAGQFDLVLTDRSMPHLDGVELVRALRNSGNRIPIMMVSASLADGGELPDDVSREIVAALPKPAKARDLLAGVKFALGARDIVPPTVRISDAIPGKRPPASRIADIFPAA